MQIVPLQKSLIKDVANVQNKAKAQTVSLMTNVLAAIKEETIINKVDFLHDLCDFQIKRAVKNLYLTDNQKKKEVLNFLLKHRSLYSTLKIIIALNKSKRVEEATKIKNVPSICSHVDESADIAVNKLLLI